MGLGSVPPTSLGRPDVGTPGRPGRIGNRGCPWRPPGRPKAGTIVRAVLGSS